MYAQRPPELSRAGPQLTRQQIVINSAASFGISSPTARPVGYQSWMPLNSFPLMSPKTASTMPSMAKGYEEYLQRHPDEVDDMVSMLASRRERLEQASFCIARSSTLTDPAADAHLESFIPPSPSLVKARNRNAEMQTSADSTRAQCMGVGRELMQEEPVFARSVGEMDAVIKTLERAPEGTLEGRHTPR